MSNEELLRQDECPRSNCIEPAGHTGPCSGDMVRRLPSLLAKVARLEADNAAMEAALRDDCDCIIMWAGCRREGWTCLDEQRRAADPDAPYVAVWRERLISGAERCRGCRNSVALSGAGKGWLPPEVAEQVRLLVTTFNEMLARKMPDEEIVGVMDGLLDNLDAALDALKGVE